MSLNHSNMQNTILDLMEFTGYDEKTLAKFLKEGYTSDQIVYVVMEVRNEIAYKEYELGITEPHKDQKRNIIFVIQQLEDIQSKNKNPSTHEWAENLKQEMYDKFASL